MRTTEDLILDALAAVPEGRPYEALAIHFGVPLGGRYRTRPKLRAALDALVTEGQVWTLPMVRHRGGVVDLYFLPEPPDGKSGA